MSAVKGRTRPTTLLVMVTIVYVVNYLDRNIVSMLLPSLQREFDLSDTQLGLLSGTSFALLYATVGVPFAWLADRTNRRKLIVASMALFSATTALSGLATSFAQLILARIATGVGEAGTSPAINSLISDVFEPRKRTRALAIYSSGLNIGLLIAFFGGGWIQQHYGWRVAFVAAGIPGLLLCAAFFALVREPTRGQSDNAVDAHRAPSFLATVRFLWSQESFRWLATATAMSAFAAYAANSFAPTFLARNHGLSSAEIGLTLALLLGVIGGIGTFGCGAFAGRIAVKDVRWNLYAPALLILVTLPFLVPLSLSSNLFVVLLCAVIPAANNAAFLGPSYAMAQQLAPLRMRAQSAATLLFVMNIIGYGTGPLLIGKLSDVLHPMFGSDALRWALLATAIPWLLSAACLWRAARTLSRDIDRAQTWSSHSIATP
jgi:predicted MFS family arabinose efflux permease